jgi:hypothetical protein
LHDALPVQRSPPLLSAVQVGVGCVVSQNRSFAHWLVELHMPPAVTSALQVLPLQ